MDCEICGCSSDLVLVSLRGTQVSTCQNCKKYGVEVPKIVTAIPKIKKVQSGDEEEEYDLVDNYTKIIQKARGNLSHKDLAMKINETESLVAKIESGKIKPTEKIIKKLQRTLNIKIYEKVE